MSDFKSWLKIYWDEFTRSDRLRIATADIQSLTDYMEDRISVSNAARKFLGDCKAKDDSIERHINILSAAAVETSNPAEQAKIVKLFLAVRNLQYRLQGNKYEKNPSKYPPYHMFPSLEMDLMDTYNSLFCDSCDENELKDHPFWININALFARLTRVRICDFRYEARERCNFFVNDTSIRSSPVLFSLALSAAVQYIIYSGSEVYEYSNITSGNGHCEWMSWKEAFISAEKNGTLNLEARAHARLALRAMTKVEMSKATPKMHYRQTVVLSKKRDHETAFQISSSKANPVTKDGEMAIGQPVLDSRPVVKTSATSHSNVGSSTQYLSAAKTLDLGISGGGVPEGKPISAVTIDIDGGSTVVLVRGVVLGSGTLLALEGNAPPNV